MNNLGCWWLRWKPRQTFHSILRDCNLISSPQVEKSWSSIVRKVTAHPCGRQETKTGNEDRKRRQETICVHIDRFARSSCSADSIMRLNACPIIGFAEEHRTSHFRVLGLLWFENTGGKGGKYGVDRRWKIEVPSQVTRERVSSRSLAYIPCSCIRSCFRKLSLKVAVVSTHVLWKSEVR